MSGWAGSSSYEVTTQLSSEPPTPGQEGGARFRGGLLPCLFRCFRFAWGVHPLKLDLAKLAHASGALLGPLAVVVVSTAVIVRVVMGTILIRVMVARSDAFIGATGGRVILGLSRRARKRRVREEVVSEACAWRAEGFPKDGGGMVAGGTHCFPASSCPCMAFLLLPFLDRRPCLEEVLFPYLSAGGGR